MSVPLTIQPIPYQGSKRSLAPRICTLFPERIGTLYEPFAGSAAVSLYAATHDLAERFVIGDIYPPLVELWRMMIERPDELSRRYAEIWQQQFAGGRDHFNEVRTEFNETGAPVLLLYLVARCVKNAVRFNRHGHFTQSVDRRRTGVKPDRLARTIHTVSGLLAGRTRLFCGDFRECTVGAGPGDLVYMDPPYQGTTYGRDKRYAAGLERGRLIEALCSFDRDRIPYLLSYDGQSGDRTYGEPLPPTVAADRLALRAGRSSQATLSGRSDVTIESLYVAHSIRTDPRGKAGPAAARPMLFAA